LEPGESSWDMEALGLSQSYYSKNAYFDNVIVFTVE
jgi:hypothetical protein